MIEIDVTLIATIYATGLVMVGIALIVGLAVWSVVESDGQ